MQFFKKLFIDVSVGYTIFTLVGGLQRLFRELDKEPAYRRQYGK
jgi:hypothetical protein